MVSASKLPRWRGFNLLSKFSVSWRRDTDARFPEEDFRIMHEWGFDFARLPMDYRCWLKDGDPRKMDEAVLAEIDEAVDLGKRYGIHTCINFHRAPGYTVAQPQEELSVWTDDEAREICALHWRAFARRYAGIPNEEVSFNLFNEPARIGDHGFTPERYREVVLILTDAIWSEDPERLVICDGYMWGRIPLQELADLGVAQSTRAYEPHWISHYKAHWVGADKELPPPSWPGGPADEPDTHWDIDNLREYWRPWKELADSGVGVHCGEGGAYHALPHPTTLAWLDDALTVLEEYGIGWALWNLRGRFGVMDSGRSDVEYEDFEGHKLDRKMLDVLQRH
ncbi:MAG: cellulase family glycosylhydrolase [Candidatus Brocadiae bacterium]|nr:cellulase family glycosylhydrolase [Candidatus Brocadiia bacterium]